MVAKSTIISYLKQSSKKLKRTIQRLDMDTDPTKPCCTASVRTLFGTWNNAIIAANLFPNPSPISMRTSNRKEFKCSKCNSTISRILAEIRKNKSGNFFCSKSCAATYNNQHKKYGIRRSKLEVYIENKLSNLYPSLKIYFNRKDVINSELDIYIPSLSLAFELNGLFHYESIFGIKKLKQIQNNDKRKFQACLKQNIELCIINVRKMTRFSPTKCNNILRIIINIINIKI